MAENSSRCENLTEILEAEVSLITRHLEKHKWYKHISNNDEAMADFIEKYGFIMREMYCSYVCRHREVCDCAKEYLKKPV